MLQGCCLLQRWWRHTSDILWLLWIFRVLFLSLLLLMKRRSILPPLFISGVLVINFVRAEGGEETPLLTSSFMMLLSLLTSTPSFLSFLSLQVFLLCTSDFKEAPPFFVTIDRIPRIKRSECGSIKYMGMDSNNLLQLFSFRCFFHHFNHCRLLPGSTPKSIKYANEHSLYLSKGMTRKHIHHPSRNSLSIFQYWFWGCYWFRANHSQSREEGGGLFSVFQFWRSYLEKIGVLTVLRRIAGHVNRFQFGLFSANVQFLRNQYSDVRFQYPKWKLLTWSRWNDGILLKRLDYFWSCEYQNLGWWTKESTKRRKMEVSFSSLFFSKRHDSWIIGMYLRHLMEIVENSQALINQRFSGRSDL